mmetsp:Transcript_15264/g.19371  ORF Transcript_15264/g.19371 Transcript_15264/m.19371 type:complete len:90 (-) Transcript_15264:122-391(-)
MANNQTPINPAIRRRNRDEKDEEAEEDTREGDQIQNEHRAQIEEEMKLAQLRLQQLRDQEARRTKAINQLLIVCFLLLLSWYAGRRVLL